MMGYVTAIVPSVGVLAIFWVAIRAMVTADRRERIAQARIEAAQDRAPTVISESVSQTPESEDPR